MNIKEILQSKGASGKYLEYYLSIIESSKRRTSGDEYLESHHILPRSLFQEYMDFKTHPWNLVRLTAKEHFVCHLLLWRMAEVNSEMYFKMGYAITCLRRQNSNQPRYTSRSYEWFRRVFKHSLETKLKQSKARIGMQFTDEHRKNISRVQEGYKFFYNPENSEEFIKFMPNSSKQKIIPDGWVSGFPPSLSKSKKEKMSEKIWITNGTENLRILPSDDIPEGWCKGRSSSAILGNITINNGITNKSIVPDELESYLEKGWSRGMKPQKERKKYAGDNSQLGKVRMTNGEENRSVSPVEVLALEQAGWRRGLTRNLTV